MHLDTETFLQVVERAPLVSIDLVIRNEHDEILLGKRSNRPAQGYWFVPGGRIFKNERLAEALERIAMGELGIIVTGAKLLGVFDHIYPDNFAGRAGVNTHYVVLAFKHRLLSAAHLRPDAQHSHLTWWTVQNILAAPDVHEHTKAYFR